jgi:hypothetical protein
VGVSCSAVERNEIFTYIGQETSKLKLTWEI